MINLSWFRQKHRGLPELLPYAALIEPDVILCKNYSFLAAWLVQGTDTASSTFSELAAISARTNEALRNLGNGWLMHMNANRTFSRAYPPEEISQYPDRITQMIDDERREFFGQDYCFNTDVIMTVTYRPDMLESQFARQAKRHNTASFQQEHLEYFRTILAQLEDTLQTVLSMERLGSYEQEDEHGQLVTYSALLSHLQYCLTGDPQPIRVPRYPVYLDLMLGGGDISFQETTPVIGDKFISAVAIGGLPLDSWPTMLSSFDALPIPFRFCHRFMFLDRWTALKEVEKTRKGWQQSMFKFLDQFLGKTNPRMNRDSYNMHEDAQEAETEIRGGLTNGGYYTPVVILMHEDLKLVTDMARDIKRHFQALGYASWVEGINAYEAWLGSIPGNAYANLRRPFINTLNLADLLPLSSVWTGLPFNPCPYYPANSRCLSVLTTDGSTPFRFNLHEGDLGHTLILGPTGSGKSTLLALIAAQFRCYPRASVYVFDKGLSMYPLAKAVGGDHYDIGRGDLAFAPLQDIDASDEEFAFAAEWIAGLAELQNLQILPKHRNAIHLALQTLAHNPREMRSLTDFWHTLQDNEVKEAIRHYTRAGAMGHLLDAKEDTLSLSSFTVFEIETLMEMGEVNLIPVLLYLFHRIENGLTGQPGLLMLDEAWVMLGHELFREKIRDWLKTFRRKNCAVMLSTQSISDASKSTMMDVLMESCLTKIFLANYAARDKVSADLYRLAGLNERQIDIIRDMIPKRDYYIVQPSGRRKVQLALGPKTLAFVGASDRDSLAQIKSLIQKNPNDWQDHWMSIRGAA